MFLKKLWEKSEKGDWSIVRGRGRRRGGFWDRYSYRGFPGTGKATSSTVGKPTSGNKYGGMVGGSVLKVVGVVLLLDTYITCIKPSIRDAVLVWPVCLVWGAAGAQTGRPTSLFFSVYEYVSLAHSLLWGCLELWGEWWTGGLVSMLTR